MVALLKRKLLSSSPKIPNGRPIELYINRSLVYGGVEKGIEKFSKILMPALFVLIVGIAVFALTIKGDYGTALDGLKIYFIPNFDGMTIGKFFMVLVDAM